MSKDTPSLSPVSIVAGVAAAAGLGLSLWVRNRRSRRCSHCSSLAPTKHDIHICKSCKGQVCRPCSGRLRAQVCGETTVEGGTFCSPECRAHLMNEMRAKVREIRELQRLTALAEKVEVFSYRYKGKVEARFHEEIESSVCGDRDEAEWELRMEAARRGCKVIVRAREIKHPDHEGNYQFQRWSMRGTI